MIDLTGNSVATEMKFVRLDKLKLQYDMKAESRKNEDESTISLLDKFLFKALEVALESRTKAEEKKRLEYEKFRKGV
jgi:hypothetical protein